VLATGGAVLTGSAAAGNSAAPASHARTIHYDAKTVSVLSLDPKDRVSSVNLSTRHLSSAGKLSGSAVFTCHLNTSHSSSELCHGALALKGGVMYASGVLKYSTYKLTGRITGGSGAFRGAHGTLSAVGDSARHSILTVTYRT